MLTIIVITFLYTTYKDATNVFFENVGPIKNCWLKFLYFHHFKVSNETYQN